MSLPLVVPFTKMSGAGNDFVVLDNRFLRFSDAELAALAAQACPRRVGVGADGLLALDDADGDADFRMRYRNADGSLATMCGNGARCLARFAARAGLGLESADGTVRLTFDTDGGRYSARVLGGRGASGAVLLNVPPPRDLAAVTGFEDMIETDGEPSPLVRIWTGTEHLVAFVENVAAVDLEAVGPRLRRDVLFAPAGTNVNVVEIAEAGEDAAPRIVVRTFEKGVEGETLACGTGALAAALAAFHTGRVHEPAMDVAMPGGTLRVHFTPGTDGVSDLVLEGPAETVFEGTLEWRG